MEARRGPGEAGGAVGGDPEQRCSLGGRCGAGLFPRGMGKAVAGVSA